jgi:uncharacterized protein YjiS (DUF1127 family)
MSTSRAAENLSHLPNFGIPAQLLGLQAWFAARASARQLYRMDDRALSDLALSRSDVERVNATAGWPAGDIR